jgi:hypothetical protein
MENCGPVQTLAWGERQLMANRTFERIVAVERIVVSLVSTSDSSSGHKQATVSVLARVYVERIPDVNRNVTAKVWVAALGSGLHCHLADR